LGTCVPLELLGSEGYLATKQSGIEKLALRTGELCGETVVDLSAFSCLRSFSWIGARWKVEFQTIEETLKRNRTHLKEIELNFMSDGLAEIFFLPKKS